MQILCHDISWHKISQHNSSHTYLQTGLWKLESLFTASRDSLLGEQVKVVADVNQTDVLKKLTYLMSEQFLWSGRVVTVVKPNGDKIRDKTTDSLIRDTLDARMCTLTEEGVERRLALSFLPVSSQLSMHVLYYTEGCMDGGEHV